MAANKYQPLVSVVTVSYNQAKYLPQTLQCIRDQDYPHIEHIVVDAVSTDGSVEIIRDFGGLDWVSEPDKGQSEGLNKGFKKAKGDIIVWLNSDDLLAHEHVISQVVEEFGRRPETKFIYGHALIIDDHDAVTGASLTMQLPQDKYKTYNNIINQPSAFFRREIFEELGYLDESYHFAMDFELWLRIAEKYPLQFVPKVFSLMRITPETKTGSGSAKFWKEDWRLYHKYAGAPLLSHFRYTWLHERFIAPIYRRYYGVIRRVFKF